MAARTSWFEPRSCAAALRLACIAVAAATFASGAIAQPYPAKPIRLVVQYAAGGGADIVARETARELAKRAGQQIIVDNRPGAGGNLASELVAKSPPDGYTLLWAGNGNTINPSLYAKMPYDPIRDLAAIALVGSVPSVLVVNPSLPVRNVKELIALAKAKPGALTQGSGGNGSTEHLAGEMFKSTAGVNMLHVPYKGGVLALTDVIGGQIALMFGNPVFALPHIQSGKVKALGVAASARLPSLPDVPTFIESGLKDFVVSVWWGVMGRAGTPKEIVNRLNREIVAGLSSPEMKARLKTFSAQPIGGTPEQFAAFFADETKRWAPIVKASGAKAD